MLKLNNHGWGLSNMIIFIVVLFIFLIIWLIISYNYGIEENSPNDIYEEIILENM